MANFLPEKGMTGLQFQDSALRTSSHVLRGYPHQAMSPGPLACLGLFLNINPTPALTPSLPLSAMDSLGEKRKAKRLRGGT